MLLVEELSLITFGPGTTNFVHSFPNACISLGLAVDRKPAVGVIYNPWQDLLFTAIKGRGAYMTRIKGTTPQKLPLAKSPRPSTASGRLSSPLSGDPGETAPTLS